MTKNKANNPRRVPNIDPKNFNDPAEYEEAVFNVKPEPESPKVTAALSKSKNSVSRANIRDILG
jgi:hypothetical protein